MKISILLSIFALARVFAFSPSTEIAPNLCWIDHEEKKLCMDDHQNEVRVLLYNGGFCAPCNKEFEELMPRISEFAGKPVRFLSLSVAGWEQFSPPTPPFLKEWKTKHNVPFPVLASSRKELYGFIPQGRLPSIVIIDQNGAVALAETNPGLTKAFAKINDLLK